MAVLTSLATPPPSNERAEMALLAALFPPLSMNPAALGVRPHHFADPVHGATFGVALLHAQRGQPIRVWGLASDLQAELEEVGGALYLQQLADMARQLADLETVSEDIAEDATNVRDAWTRRQLIDLGENLHRIGEEAVQDAFGFTSRASAEEQAETVLKALQAAATEAASIVSRMDGEAQL